MIYDEHKLIHIAIPKTGTSCIFKMIHSIPLDIDMTDGLKDGQSITLSHWFKNPQGEDPRMAFSFLHGQMAAVHKAGLVVNDKIAQGHPLYNYYKKGHVSYQEYESMIEDYPYYKEYKYFTFIRNPYDIMVSNYFYQSRGAPETECLKLPFKAFCWGLLSGHTGEEWKTQVDYLKNKDGKVEMDFIGMLENFNVHWKQLRELFPTLPTYSPSYRQTNISKRRFSSTRQVDFREMYDGETQKLVLKYFEEDFDTFHYPSSFSVPTVPWRWPSTFSYPGFKELSFKELQDNLDNS